MESPKMYSSCRCKNLTYLWGTANDPVSSKPVQGRERKFAEFRVYLQPGYCICTKAMCISKGSYGYGESKNVFLQLSQKTSLTCCGTANDPISSKPVQGLERKFAESGSSFSLGTVFAPKQCLYLKGSYGYGESKNVFLSSVQKPHLHVRDCKRPRLK